MLHLSTRSSSLTLALVLAISGTAARAQWTVTVLEPGTPGVFARANAVCENRQGGSRDNGYSVPRQWLGTAASGATLAEPGPDSGAAVYAVTPTSSFGDGYVRTSQTEGYYAALLWNASGSSVTIFPPPANYSEAHGLGAGGNQQVGYISGETGIHPALWTGTPQSLVNLLPAGTTAAGASATDGAQQVGFAIINGIDIAALWSGTAASFINLHPPAAPQGWLYSWAVGVSEGRQVGGVSNDNESHAAAWQGTAASFVDIHPAGVLRSQASAISKGRICGWVSIDGPEYPIEQAAYWSGPSASLHVNLHAALPLSYVASRAMGIWTDSAGVIRVVGSAYNAITNTDEAVLWTSEVALGACCNGTSCSVTMSNACAGVHQGGATTCGPVTCCGAPIGGPASIPDCDGDLVNDACTTPSADCNHDGLSDPCQTLQFTNANFSTGPGAFTFNGHAGLQGTSAVLTPSLPGQMGSIVRPPLTVGVTGRLRAIFDFRISQTDSYAADGLAFSLLDAGLYTTAATFGEDGVGGPGVITIKFNTYQNFAGEGGNSMFVRYNGANVAQNLSLPFTLIDARWHRAIVELTPAGRISVKLATNPGDLATVFDNVQLPGYVPFRALIGFGGRTGSYYSKHEVANIRLGVNGPNDSNGNGIPDTCECRADFNHSGSPSVQDIFDFLAAYFGNDPRADVNGSGAIGVQDIFDFLALYFAGCP